MSTILKPRIEGKRTDVQSCGYLDISAKLERWRLQRGSSAQELLTAGWGQAVKLRSRPLSVMFQMMYDCLSNGGFPATEQQGREAVVGNTWWSESEPSWSHCHQEAESKQDIRPGLLPITSQESKTFRRVPPAWDLQTQ